MPSGAVTVPLSKGETEDVFLDLTQKFGFQRESMRNMVCSTFCISSAVVGLGVRGAPYSAPPNFPLCLSLVVYSKQLLTD